MRRFLQKAMALAAAVLIAGTMVHAQNSFSYQAVVRGADGKLLPNKEVSMRISMLNNNVTYYQEKHEAISNAYGNVNIIVGEGEVLSGKFSDVPWSTMKVMLKVEIDPEGGNNYTDLGATQINPVPYSMYAAKAGYAESAPATNSIVAGSTDDENEPLFVVKDNSGMPVFAVYQNSVYIYVNDSKAQRSGFYVRGATKAKDDTTDLFAIDNSGTQVFVSGNDSKAQRSGFYVRGATKAKDDTSNLFSIDNSGTQVFVSGDDSKAQRSAFYVRGATKAKDDTTNLFAIDNSGTQVFVNYDDSKAQRSAFYVRGATKAKGDYDNYMLINPDSTAFFINDDDSKAQRSAFYVRGATKAKDEHDYFAVSSDSTRIYIATDSAADNTDNARFAIVARNSSDNSSNNIFSISNDKVKIASNVVGIDGNIHSSGAFAHITPDGFYQKYAGLIENCFLRIESDSLFYEYVISSCFTKFGKMEAVSIESDDWKAEICVDWETGYMSVITYNNDDDNEDNEDDNGTEEVVRIDTSVISEPLFMYHGADNDFKLEGWSFNLSDTLYINEGKWPAASWSDTTDNWEILQYAGNYNILYNAHFSSNNNISLQLLNLINAYVPLSRTYTVSFYIDFMELYDKSAFNSDVYGELLYTHVTASGLQIDGYKIITQQTEHGTIDVSTNTAAENQTVNIYVNPDYGYVLSRLTITDDEGTIINYKDSTIYGMVFYTFRMPASEVKISATFVQSQQSQSYAISTSVSEGGSIILISSSGDTINPGQTITSSQIVCIGIIPYEGYTLSRISIVDGSNKQVECNMYKDEDEDEDETQAYYFTMPESSVTVNVSFISSN